MGNVVVNREESNVVIEEPQTAEVQVSRKEINVVLEGGSTAEVTFRKTNPRRVTIEEGLGKTTAEQAYDMALQAIATANNALESAKGGALDKYTIEEYETMRRNGTLEHKMYCVYNKGRLVYVYIGRTLLAKRADEGEAVTSSKFPLIFPIIFA